MSTDRLRDYWETSDESLEEELKSFVMATVGEIQHFPEILVLGSQILEKKAFAWGYLRMPKRHSEGFLKGPGIQFHVYKDVSGDWDCVIFSAGRINREDWRSSLIRDQEGCQWVQIEEALQVQMFGEDY